MNAEVILKSTGAVTEVSGDVVDLTAPSIVRLDMARADVATMERQGSDLVMRLANGEQMRVADFYPEGDAAVPHDLVLRENDGTLWHARTVTGVPRYAALQDLDDLLAAQAVGGGGSSLALPAALLGGAAAAGAAAAAAGGGGNDDAGGNTGGTGGNTGGTTPGQPAPGTGGTTPDRDPPAAPSVTVRGDGAQITGRGEAGATVQVRGPDGVVVGTGVVGADGAFTVTLSPPRTGGEPLVVTQIDAAGNVSAATSTQAPDLTAPAAPTAEIGADGAGITGRGESGATVTIRDASGAVVATAIVGADGTYTATLTPAQANGGTVSVTQSDAAGNVSTPTTVSAPDITAPGAPTAAIGADGTSITGTGEPGASVTVSDAAGTVIATATVAADGSYSASLSPVQDSGAPVTVNQTDAAGNASAGVTVATPDLTAPGAPVATLDATGSVVSGTGEPGARISVSTTGGGEIGTATVDARGSYSIILSTPQGDGQAVVVTQTDAAGNVSPGTSLTAPDITAPAAPTGVVAADGASLAGTGEAGATITIRSPVGAVVGSAVVGADGSYVAVLSPAQIDGELLSVRQADAAGNVSPPADAAAPDLVVTAGPDAPTAAVGADGSSVAGTAAAGATVTVFDATGIVIATGVAGVDGGYGIALAPPRTDGETIRVTQTDANGAVSPPVTAIAPDLTAPDAPAAAIDATGSVVTGTGQPGAAVTVRAADGTVIGTATAGANGAFAVVLTPAQTDGTSVAVTQADGAGNVSAPSTIATPDFAVPLAPTAIVSADGGAVTGGGEAGASVVVRDASGVVLGSGTAGADGAFTVRIAPAQANGETLSVTVSDAGGNVSPATVVTAPDITAPALPVAQIGGDGGTVAGTGEPGATITVRDAADTVIGTAIVAADGSYSVTLTPAQTNAETVRVSQVDAAGNVSASASVVAPDFTAPAQPSATIAGDGASVSGTGEPGAAILITGATGATLGTAVVAGDGSYTAPLDPAQANGEALRVVQTDAAGNASAPLPLTAPNITAPPAPGATLDPSGAVVTGTGEIGARVTVVDGAGTLLGSAVVTAQGNYSITLSTPQIDSQALSVTQRDAAGNLSPATGLTAPDITAPGAPIAQVGADGGTVTGTGEPGATVVVRAPLGGVVGTAVVNADGSYSVAVTPAQIDGEVLVVRQTDAAGNVSPIVTAVAPDLVADTAPDAPTATVGSDGASVGGTAIGGAAITVYDATGTQIGTGVANPDGSYAVALNPARIDGEIMRVTQTDADGDVSPPATATAPDLTAPAAPTAAIDNTGAVVTGTGEPGATITIRAADTTLVGTATVGANGAYAATLTTIQIDGEALSVAQIDVAGNASQPIALRAPDFTVPAAPVVQIGGDGSVVTGTGEAGATVTVRDAANVVIGTATVAADGSFTATLTPAQANGGTISVVQADAAGNVSATVPLAAPDITPPAIPVVQIANDGSVVTGTGEAGATVTVRDAANVVIGTATVAADGSFTATLTPAQANGGTISVVQADAAGNVSATVPLAAPDITPPAVPVAQIANDGSVVTGTGEAGATVTVRDAANVVIGTATVAADGSFTATLTPAQANGGTISVVQADAAGNVSAAVPLVAPDITPPAIPVAQIANDGSVVTGTGEAGATVTVRDAANVVIGTATVATDGSFTATLTPAQANGGTISVVQADAAGNVSVAVPLVAPDITPPAVPVVQIANDGSVVTGTGEAGATVTVRDAANVVVGTATVAADGSFTATLTPAQANGGAISVVQADAAGNVSAAVPLAAPDITPPAIPVAQIANDGSVVTGTGEAGATVTVRDAANVVVGTATVAANGSFTATLTPAQANGGTLSVVQADAAGNASAAVPLVAPDITAPAAPVVQIANDGITVTGTGEAGASVTIVVGAVTVVTQVAGDGSFTATLSPAQVNGETITVTQADPAGNVSAAAIIVAPDLTVPAAPTATVAQDGASVVGTGEVGARIVVTNAAGGVVGVAVVADDGSYSARLDPPLLDGERLTATQTDGGGNISPPAVAVAPDLTAPSVPTLIVANDGASASGVGEAGATVTLRNPDGSVIGSVVAAGDGSFTFALSPPRLDGQILSVTQADATGNVSVAAFDAAPDTTAPAAPTAAITVDGATVQGVGEPGATVTVRGVGGVPLGSGIVAADGSYSIALGTVQSDGQALLVSQRDPTGNVSPDTPVTAPDVTPPAAPTAIVAIDGASVTGVGEAGATVTIRDADGLLLGSQVVAIDGSYTVTLSPPQTDGELLSASQRDLTGNASPTTSVFAPDTTAPDVPVAIVSADGTFVTGRGEPGTTVTVTGAGGLPLGTATVGAGGTYAVALSSPQIDGQTLSVTLTDSARNVSLPATPIAPDGTAPLAPTASITADGTAAVGVGIVGSTITVTNAAGLVLGTAIVAADGSYAAPLDPPQRNGELLGVVQADIAGNFSPSIPAVAPDTTAPAAPAAVVGSEGTVVVGSGEPGATVTITSSGGVVLGTAVVSTAGAYVVTLATAQRNGETVVATQSDGAGNISGSTTAVAPDLTAPPPPTVTVIADDGTALTGRGEAGARVEVRAPDATLLGSTTVNADGSFAVGLVPAQTAGATLSVTQADLAGNMSLPSTIVAPFDISAFDNVDTAAVDLLPATTAVNLGQADYLALVSLNVVNLQAEVLTTGNVRFSVQQGHSLDAVFTFGTVADIEVAGSYVVAVQRLENGRWVSVNGTGAASLLEINVINGDLVATNTLGPGEYRAFATVQGGAANVALLSTLNVTGVDSNFTAVAGAAPIPATGNVITEAGPGGELDIVGPGTRVVSVTVNGVTTELAPDGSTVTGAWGTLTMNRDGSYSYAPTANVATIGKTDVFTYTLIDPTDGERASANLSITIGSPDIGGAPVAVADQAFADVTFQNVVTTLPPAQAFSFSAGLTGSRSGSFAVAPNTSSDITIVADRQAGLGLSVLPQYTVTIRNSSGATVRTASATAVANGLLGTSTFTFDDLPSGTYSYTVASQSTLSLGSFTTNVSLGSSTTFLDQFTLASAETATGNLLANDSTNTAFAAIRVDAGGGFAEIGATPVTLTGAYGTLTVNETGGYVYQPSASLGYSAVDLTDSFTYQVVQPNGVASSAVLTVTIDVPADGPAVAPVPATLFAAFAAGEDGAIPLDALTLDGGESVIVTPDGAAIGLAAYDLFEGKGELEDVLSHYLTEPQTDPASDTAEFVHPAAVENTMLPVVEDPFSFLATLPDQDQNGTVTNHVV